MNTSTYGKLVTQISPVERDRVTGARSYSAMLDGFAAKADASEVFVALLDIDDFRLFNDEYGVDCGDAALREIASILQGDFGEDSVFRYGSDEFIVVGAFQDETTFLATVEKAFADVAAIDLGIRKLGITLSVGYLHGVISSAAQLHEAVRIADRKMHEAKRRGKARAVGALLADGESEHGSIALRGRTYKAYETDELTGLSNLVHFRNQLGALMGAADGEGGDRLAVIYFNIENFKGFNERFGFSAGDELLQLVSGAIQSAFPDRPVGRASADQFMVAATDSTSIDGILEIRSAFRKRIKDSSIWVKAGVYVIEDGEENVGLACDRAKLACDAIKGRHDVFYRFYDAELRRQIDQRRYVLDHFEEALEDGWIKIYYQPIMRVATGEVCDEEALARWDDPERGLIAPADFIPVLEEARLIHRLDLYMVRRACKNMFRLREDGIEVVPVSLNLSRLDFELCDIVSEVEAILEEFDVPRDMFAIEVTESALAGNQEFLKSEIDRFRADGFEVWMDDFGSGYSSLHLLTEYNFDLVKIDMEFLRDFETNEQTRIMLAHIISMSKELGLKTLVEGVETDEQFAFLKSIGCGRAQGFLLGRPSSLHDVEVASAALEYPEIEIASSHAFFEEVGRINLMRPDPVPPIDGHYVPGDVAAAIVCRMDGVYEYYNVTDIYRKHLKRMGIESIAAAARALNDPMDAVRHRFEVIIERLNQVGDSVSTSYTANGNTCDLHIRLIATYPEAKASALLVIARSVSFAH